MKKVFALLLSVAMVICMMPSMAFASGETVSFSPASLDLVVGGAEGTDTAELTATVAPKANAGNFVFTSSDTESVTVEKGDVDTDAGTVKLTVKAIAVPKSGSVTISVKPDGEAGTEALATTCTVNVTAAPAEEEATVAFEPAKAKLIVGGETSEATTEIIATVTPAANVEDFVFESSDKDSVTVTPSDANTTAGTVKLTVKAVAMPTTGSVTITAKPDSEEGTAALETTCTVTVVQNWKVAITAGANMTAKDNTLENQTVTAKTGIEDVVYTADEGYYFPTDYIDAANATTDGITVTRNSYTQITVSGTPTAAVDLTLEDATAKEQEETPTATFEATGADCGTLKGVAKGMKYSLDGGKTWKTIDSEGTTVNIESGVIAGTNIIWVVKPASDVNTKLDSEPCKITVTQAATPTAGKTDCSAADQTDGKLTSVDNTMEYKKSDANGWTAIEESQVDNLGTGIYYVRVAAGSTVLASDYQIVQIAVTGAEALTGTVEITSTEKFGETLTASVGDDTNSTSKNFTYIWKRGTTNIGSGNTYTIVAADVGQTITCEVYADDRTGKITSVATGTIGKAAGPAAPTGLGVKSAATVGGAGGTITGTTTAMEYSDDDSSYAPCTATETTVSAVGKYYVRYAETDTHEAGTAAEVTVLAATVDSVTVTPATPSVQKGGSQKFTATVAGSDGIGQGVTWTVEGSTSDKTAIGADGTLLVGDDETATTLTVKATAKADGTTNGTAAVTVTIGGGSNPGGGYVPPVTDPLPTAKNEATNAVQNYVKPADYEEAEAAAIKAIMDKAAEDIKNAKTEEEVKAIEAAAKAEIDKLDTAEEKAVIRTVEATKFRATSKRTTLNGKKAIKITWTVPEGAEFDGYDVFRSTKQFSGFGKTPFFTTTKQTYTNNKGLEVGKTYYYKVRAYKYVNGRKVYSEYSYKAIRTMK